MSGVHPWMAELARLGPDDLRLISTLVDRLIVADRPQNETAQLMLAARPAPATHDESRERVRSVITYLENHRAAEKRSDAF